MEEQNKPPSHRNESTYSIKPYKVIAQCLGIWCMTCLNVIPNIQLIIICILVVINAISLLHELNPECGEVKDALKTASIGMSSCLAVIKILSIRLNSDKMLPIITSIMEDWSSIKNEDNLRIMSSAAKIGQKILFFQLGSAYLSAIPMFLCGVQNTVVFDDKKNETEVVKLIPLENPCFYRYIFDDFYTEIYLLQILQIIATILGNVGCDCYFFGITMHLVGQINCFGRDIEKFEPQEGESKNHEILRVLILRHIHLMRMADNMEKTFNVAILFQVIANVLQISMAGLQLLVSIRHGDGGTMMNFTIFITIFLVQISLYSYAGDRLSSSIGSLQISLYCCPWYQRDRKTSKDFLLMMTRYGKPFHLTAGKIIHMNLDSYKNIIKTLGSYFSVMQAMFDE
ncbi:odorant receptor 4-like [Diachasmimorpha longicaudata]|uniref:odorant receptor 4-like n=1 Tax=Diachasmimorpha longicaudata TaxID=58733 RepID=UPI0030B87D98